MPLEYLPWISVCIILHISVVFVFLTKIKKLKSEITSLKNKFRDNPSYETQLMLADMFKGDSFFHIERIPPESFLLRRD